MMGNIDTNQFLGYGLLGFGAVWIYKKMQSNAAAKGALAMKWGTEAEVGARTTHRLACAS